MICRRRLFILNLDYIKNNKRNLKFLKKRDLIKLSFIVFYDFSINRQILEEIFINRQILKKYSETN